MNSSLEGKYKESIRNKRKINWYNFSMSEDTLGIYCKELENKFTKERADKTKPLLARLDGRAFHTYTKGLKRPYDERLSACMIETTKALIEEFHPRIVYTQSDEISLLFYADPEYPTSYIYAFHRYTGNSTTLYHTLACQFWMQFPGYRDWETDRKSTRLNSSHSGESRMPSSA